MSFQGNAFQGDAFQVGLPGAYPFNPATTTSYIDGLPDRVRIVFYQALASAPTPPAAATTTPTTAGLQDLDRAFVRPFRAVEFQFSGFIVNDTRAATPITAGLQDLDLAFKRPFNPHQFADLVTITGVRASTPTTAGLQDLDLALRRRLLASADFTFTFPTAAPFETEGFDDFDVMIQRRPRVPPQDITSAILTRAAFETEGFDDFDQSIARRPRLPPQDITFTVFIQAFNETEGFDDFDVLQPPRRRLPFWEITTSYPTSAATATPTTAGVEPIFGPLIKRPYLDQLYATNASNQNQVAQTPITAGLQDFDYRFRIPFRPPQFSGFITIDGVRATTPTTAGLQDFDRLTVQRQARVQDFGTSLVSQIRAITAGIQGFDALLRRQMAQDPALPLVAVPAAAARAGTQGLDLPARPRASLAQTQPFAVTTGATATPITAGLQDLDRWFVRPYRPALQQVTGWAPTVISVAATPGPFQFAYAGLPPFRYGMRAKLQTFESRGQNVGIRFIIHKPGLGSLLTPQLLAGTKDVPSLAGAQGQPGLSGMKDQPGLAGTKDQPGLGGEVEGDN